MSKRDYDYLEQIYDQLFLDYNYAQDEIKDLKEYIEILKALCLTHGIEVPERKISIPF